MHTFPHNLYEDTLFQQSKTKKKLVDFNELLMDVFTRLCYGNWIT